MAQKDITVIVGTVEKPVEVQCKNLQFGGLMRGWVAWSNPVEVHVHWEGNSHGSVEIIGRSRLRLSEKTSEPRV